jgi:ubiquinone/menaquinone biosynthesis C-methylase UbiE
MLPRVLEPEVMDSIEEARDYDAMDHGQVNGVFVADFLAFWKGSAGTVLDVGTGTAQIPIELCRQLRGAKVLGIDLAENMLAVGRDNVRKAGLNERIELRCLDAKGTSLLNVYFHAVMSNSIIHHIPEPASVLAEMVRLTPPGRTIFVRDLLRPKNDADVKRLVDYYAGNATQHQKQMFEDSLRAALTLDEIRSLVADLGFPVSSVTQTTDRHWTWATCSRRL